MLGRAISALRATTIARTAAIRTPLPTAGINGVSKGAVSTKAFGGAVRHMSLGCYRRAASHQVTRSLSSAAPAASASDAIRGLAGRHLLRTDDYSPAEFGAVVDLALALKAAHADGGRDDPANADVWTSMRGQSMAMIFQKRSTRTRVSTETGIAKLGGQGLFLSADDIQLGVNESVRDSARVLCRFNDILLARVFGHGVVDELARESAVPVINALSDLHHPLQILADVMTLREHWAAAGGTEGKTLAWVGDGNNILHDLLLAAPLTGMRVRCATPTGYEPDAGVVADARALFEREGVHGGGDDGLLFTTDPKEAVQGADVVVTDTWVSMGQEEEAARRLKDFAGYEVTHELMVDGGANDGWCFLHCLPRHPEEVSDAVFYDEARSLVWQEAENRMWTVMAVMLAQVGRAPLRLLE